MVDIRNLANPVYIPVRYIEYIARAVCLLAFGICPVGYPVTRGVSSCNQATAGGRTDTAGIGLGEHHTLFGKALHIRSFVYLVVVCLLGPERQGCILPAHVVYHEENDVGACVRTSVRLLVLGLQSRGSQWSQCEGDNYFLIHRNYILEDYFLMVIFPVSFT